MEIENRVKKIVPISSAVGIICILCGLAVAYINVGFAVPSLALAIIGLLLCIASMLFNRHHIKELLSLISVARFARAFLILLISFVALVALNYLALKYDMRWDLTANRQHTISQTTRDFIKNLEYDAMIIVLYVGPPPKYIQDLMGEYENISNGKIKTEIIDPLVDLGRAAQFDNVISTTTKRAIVQSRGERQDIDFKEGKLTEAFLTNAIIKATRDRRRVYFVSGHEEYDIDDTGTQGFSIFDQVLKNNNCITSEIMLGITKKVPRDCNVLIIAGPKNPYTETEKDIIQAYLEQGGKALFFIESTPMTTEENPLSEHDKLKNPALNGILNYWGVHIGDDVVVDIENYVGNDVGIPATKNYPAHDKIVAGLDYTFYVRPRSITRTEAASADIKVAPLVYTASKKNSWAETNRFLKVKFDEDEDTPGPVSIAAIIWGPKNEERKDDTKIIVFTDADFASNSFIAQYSNANIALNSIGWLTELDNVMPIEETEEGEGVERFDLTSKQIRIITVILVAMPFLIAFCGGMVWWYRSNK